jgi:DNA-directed RNA polymerase subunit RPC12/RpoP
MEPVFCAKCGRQLDESTDLPCAERIPCPDCGSTSRSFYKSAHDSINMSDHVSALHQRKGKTIGFRESARQGRSASADQGEDGELSYTLNGSSPQGEEDTLLACRILVNKLNNVGGNWQPPTIGEGVIDCQAVDRQCKERKLYIQVVRANVDTELWKTLNLEGKIERRDNSTALAKQIKSAIEAKVQKVPTASRRGLVLALDATRLPALGFDAVVEDFHSKWSPWASALGFDSIWLVGPSESLTWQLDKL